MPDVLSHRDDGAGGRGHGTREASWSWRRSGSTDALTGAVAALLISGLLAVGARPSVTPPEPRPAAQVGNLGSRPNLDLAPGENLGPATRGASDTRSAVASATALVAALDRVVVSLCGGAHVSVVLSRSTSADFARGDYVVTARQLGVPMKERPTIGTVAVRLRFRGDRYEFAARRRSGMCRG